MLNTLHPLHTKQHSHIHTPSAQSTAPHTYTFTHPPLTAQGTAPQFIVQPINVTVYGSASIQCSALGSPQPTLLWFKDEVRVVLDSRISVDSLGYLQISSVQNTDAGDYYCMASNAVGSVRSTVGTLSIACKFTCLLRILAALVYWQL